MEHKIVPSAIADNKEGMTSLEIAEATGKQHAHVMRDIRAILAQGVQQSNFGLMFKISKIGNGAERKDPYYSLTPKGCLILASGYDALLRERIIDRLENLEKHASAPSYQYGKSAKAFNILLRNFGIQRKVGTSWVLYGKHLSHGYVQSKTFVYDRTDGTQGARTYVEWTQKGRLFLYEELKKRGVLPLIEQPSAGNEDRKEARNA